MPENVTRSRPKQEKIDQIARIVVALLDAGNDEPNCKDIGRVHFNKEKLHGEETNEIRDMLKDVRKYLGGIMLLCLVNKKFCDRPKRRTVDSLDDARQFICGKPYGLYRPTVMNDPILAASLDRRHNGAVGVANGSIRETLSAAEAGLCPTPLLSRFANRLRDTVKIEAPYEEETPEE